MREENSVIFYQKVQKEHLGREESNVLVKFGKGTSGEGGKLNHILGEGAKSEDFFGFIYYHVFFNCIACLFVAPQDLDGLL